MQMMGPSKRSLRCLGFNRRLSFQWATTELITIRLLIPLLCPHKCFVQSLQRPWPWSGNASHTPCTPAVIFREWQEAANLSRVLFSWLFSTTNYIQSVHSYFLKRITPINFSNQPCLDTVSNIQKIFTPPNMCNRKQASSFSSRHWLGALGLFS